MQAERQSIDRRAIPAGAVESRFALADGHEIRRIDLPAEDGGKRGSILFMPGRGDFYEKYLETLIEWSRAGWHVTAADWRGQAGSGRLGDDAITGHVGDFSDWVDDLAFLWKTWKTETRGPHIVVGHSMGGTSSRVRWWMERSIPTQRYSARRCSACRVLRCLWGYRTSSLGS